ncbi:MAG: fasciclin domain-containing protein [Desulfobacterales bacterium]|nr:fasciclin domain-containing protein [Desulfobacterales bacterium]MDX2510433.1 fasciclin domain-containing protein [Desulfobacterales bacterium]
MILTLVACGSSSNNNDDPLNIVETAEDDGRFATLVAALQAAGLDDDLAGDGPFTVFAPTDDAFNLLPAGTVDTLLEPANQALLVDILTFHVYNGEVLATDAIALAGTAATMLNGSDLRIDVINNEVILSLNGNRQATVTSTDIVTANGVIHVIDTVLDPGDATVDIVATAENDGRFGTLVAALGAAELVDELQGPGPLTVFAPTDAAFAALPAGTVDTLLEAANQGTLIDILLYHVFEGSVLAVDAIALDGNSVDMFNGASMSIDVVGSTVVLNQGGSREAMVTQTDVLTSNGVIHVIDVVLDPDQPM